MKFYNTVTEVVIDLNSNIQELKNKCFLIKNKNIAIRYKGDISQEILIDFVKFLQGIDKEISIRSDDPSIFTNGLSNVVALISNTNNPNYKWFLKDLNASPNYVGLRYEPTTYNQAFFYIKDIYSFYKKFNFFYMINLQQCCDIASILDEIRKLPEDLQRLITVFGIGQCFSRENDKYNISVHSLFDIAEVVSCENIISITPSSKIHQQAKYSFCKECSKNSKCLGVPKGVSKSEVIPTYETYIKDYISITEAYNQFINYKNSFNKDFPITLDHLNLDVNNPDNYLLNKYLKFLNDKRLFKNFEGEDFYIATDFSESFYFNRPLHPLESMWLDDNRGLKSINWQFIGKDIPELEWKTKCDLLVPFNGFAIISKIKFRDLSKWSKEVQEELDQLTFSSIKKAILNIGGDENKLQQQGNDLLYNGKKFAGREWKFAGDLGLIENVVVTCSFNQEKKWFDKLYHYKGEKIITGISDELPLVDKNYLKNSILKSFKDFSEKYGLKISPAEEP